MAGDLAPHGVSPRAAHSTALSLHACVLLTQAAYDRQLSRKRQTSHRDKRTDATATCTSRMLAASVPQSGHNSRDASATK